MSGALHAFGFAGGDWVGFVGDSGWVKERVEGEGKWEWRIGEGVLRFWEL